MKQKIIYILLAGIILLTACSGTSDADLTPTVDPNAFQTQIVQTFAAGLTETALAAPSQTPFPTLTASATFQPFATTSGTPPTASGNTIPATTSCYQMRFVSDVTIPDNTSMTPGQTFTKTWKVKNTGSCAWDAGFKFAFTGGDAMSGATYTLPSAVAANAEASISVAMTAPINKTGAIRSNWRMSTAGGQFFGDEVYVLIVIGGITGTPPTATSTTNPSASTATATATSTATETPTATATP